MQFELDEHRAIFESVIAGKIDTSIELLCSHYDKTRAIIEKRFPTVQHQRKKQG